MLTIQKEHKKKRGEKEKSEKKSNLATLSLLWEPSILPKLCKFVAEFKWVAVWTSCMAPVAKKPKQILFSNEELWIRARLNDSFLLSYRHWECQKNVIYLEY